LTALPGGVAAPQCLGVTEQPDAQLWLWREDVQPPHDAPWLLPCFARAAYHFGTFGGAYLRQRSRPAAPWLSHHRMRAWVDAAAPLIDRAQQPGGWDHALLQRHVPAAVVDAVLTLGRARDARIARRAQLPQTLCHHDVWRTNLFARTTTTGAEETVAIDWELVGLGAAGEDMGKLLGVSVLNLEVDARDADALAETLVTQYLAGLGAGGWDERGWARYSAATGAGFLVAFVLPSLGFGQVAGLVTVAGLLPRLTLVIGWTWLAVLAVALLRSPAHRQRAERLCDRHRPST